ncbi:DNA polymerase type-X family protein pol4 [Lachnellula suecica]|uniref:DNA polymerase n=1 Tax=Lachnellula suecica TaxID=602035 RepID=A0A8T9C9Z2_9HELO|nr:DNA polymerase type-X family protein pol4 [Lachnellula suecica]
MAPELPSIYLLKAHFSLLDLQELSKEIGVVFKTREADLFLAHEKLKNATRVQFELRAIGVRTEEVNKRKKDKQPSSEKWQKVEKNRNGDDVIDLDSSTESDSDSGTEAAGNSRSSSRNASRSSSPPSGTPVTAAGLRRSKEDTIKVLRLDWYYDSVRAGTVLPIDQYMIYEGRPVSPPQASLTDRNKGQEAFNVLPKSNAASGSSGNRYKSVHSRSQGNQSTRNQTPHLIHETTSDHEDNASLPPLPEFSKSSYSCQRPTPRLTKNDDFIAQLTIIEHARHLTEDDNKTSVYSARSYSTAIAAIAAYPYTLKTGQEIRRLKGIGEKTQHIFEEWKEYGYIQEVDRILKDERLNALHTFWNIYDVGPKTARDWYDKKGWRDLEDVKEAFSSLPRGQQLGTKYYEEFEERIPRSEAERIGAIVLEHANELRPGFQMVICGGYRRGKPNCGDVDVILTHPDEKATYYFVKTLLDSLEVWYDEEDVKHGYITQTLKFSTANSKRNQATLAYKKPIPDPSEPRSGFDTLDTMLVAWQDQEWPTKAEDLKADPNAINPNIHRRVDIIITPWKTAGCAIIGWSGGTMFERDLRRYCRKKLNYKFDSSGVRSTVDRTWIDLEAGADDLLSKEKKVFEGLRLTWREPTERCTG